MSTQISDEIRAIFKNVGLSEVEQDALSHFLHGLREKDAAQAYVDFCVRASKNSEWSLRKNS